MLASSAQNVVDGGVGREALRLLLQQRLRGDPARRQHAGHGRLRDRGADPPAQELGAHADHLRHRVQRRDARRARLLARRGRLHPDAGRSRRCCGRRWRCSSSSSAKTEQVDAQAESLRRRRAQLQQLAHAALAINSADSVEAMARRSRPTARRRSSARSRWRAIDARRSTTRSSAAACAGPGRERAARRARHRALAGRLPRRCGSRAKRDAPHPRGTHDGRPPATRLAASPLVGRDGGNDRRRSSSRGQARRRLRPARTRTCSCSSRRWRRSPREHRSSARRARRTALKDEFLATLSHELRTPLNAIRSWAHILRRSELDAGRRSRAALEVIERNARAQTQLIEDLLDVSRIITGKLRCDVEPVDARSRSSQAAVDDARPPRPRRKAIRVDAALDAEPLVVAGDADRLQQVVGEPPLERDQVHARRAGGSTSRSAPRRNDVVASRQRHGQRHRARLPAARLRALPPGRRHARRGGTAASASGSRSCATSSSCTAARSTAQRRAKGRARPSP